MSLFTAEGGNLDCIHPAQAVIDAICSDHKMFYAEQLEKWFASYGTWRGQNLFKPMSDAVAGLNFVM